MSKPNRNDFNDSDFFEFGQSDAEFGDPIDRALIDQCDEQDSAAYLFGYQHPFPEIDEEDLYGISYDDALEDEHTKKERKTP